MLSLHDKVSIITGAGSGIGRSTAVLFHQLGAKLTLLDKNEASLNETAALCQHESHKRQTAKSNNGEIVKVVGHVEEESVLRRAVDATLGTHGQLNILVNNAGIFAEASPLLDTSIEEYDRLMSVNARSVLILTKMCAPHLILSKGCIINVSSTAGTHASAGMLPYAMSKAALDQFTKCTALELAEHGVRVNSVNPGHVITNIRRTIGSTQQECKEYYEKISEFYPVRRVGSADEIANTIAFLASDMSSFTTGQLVVLDGGLSLTCAMQG